MGNPQKQGLALPWIGGVVLGATVMMIAPARAALLDGWQFNQDTQQLVITLPKGVTPQYHLAAEPARIVVDLPNMDVGNVPVQQSYSGAVRQIRIAQFQPGLARIVLELSPEAVLAPGQVELQQLDGAEGNSQRWALRPLLITDMPNPTVAQATPSEAVTPSEATTPSENGASPTVDSSVTPTVIPVETTSSGESPASTVPAPATVSVPPTPTAPTDATPTTPTEAAQSEPPAEVAVAPSPDNSSHTGLPPLEPGAVEIPVQMEAPTAPAPTEPATASSPDIAPAEPEASTAAESPAPTVATAPVPRPSVPTTSVSVPATPAATPAPVIPPTAAVSAPLPVDFSMPPPELTPSTGTAASLALPSVGQTAINAPTVPIPSSGTLSFPRPTASGVSVPSINTVTAETPTAETPTAETPTAEASIAQPNPEPPANQPAANQPTAEPVAEPVAAADRPVPSVPSVTPTAQPIPASQPIPAQTAQAAPAEPAPTPTPEIPFGQPLATGQSSPSTSPAPTLPVPSNSSPAPTTPIPAPANNAIPFGQPIPTPQPSAPATPEIPVIQFGQPLPVPQSSINSLPETGKQSATAVVPSGTVLKLRYAGESALSLAEQASQQEVLLLEQAVHDQSGNLVFPAGSPVIGHFETNEAGSQFIVQAVQIQGQNVALKAESDKLAGGRQIQQNGMLRNSAIGAVAGTLLGAVTGIGLIPAVIAGAATSAATTYVTSPEGAAVIQPNQVVEVRLTQDLVQ